MSFHYSKIHERLKYQTCTNLKLLLIIFRFLAIILLISTLILASTNFFDFRLSEKKIDEAFAPLRYSPKHHFIETGKGKLHYVSIGDSTNTPLLMVHGSPGSWDNFVELVSETKILSEYFVLMADRPGYGETSIAHTPKLRQQALLIDDILERHFDRKGILLGHSYGAAVALFLAAENPQQVQAVVSVAGTIAPKYQNPRWYNYAVRYTPVKWVLSDLWRTSNREMWWLSHGLTSLHQKLDEADFPITVVQGGSDWLVHSHSAEYFKSQFPDERVKIFWQDDMNHFVIWTDKNVVLKALNWVSHTTKASR